MDKVIIKLSENIDLIENDQNIIERDNRQDGVPRKRLDNKVRPSKMRKDEWDGQGGKREIWKAKDTDTDYSWNYPSVSNEVDQSWNAQDSHATQMLSPGDQGTVVPLGNYWASNKLSNSDKVFMRFSSSGNMFNFKRKNKKNFMKQENDFSMSQENKETVDSNDEFRTMQVRLD